MKSSVTSSIVIEMFQGRCKAQMASHGTGTAHAELQRQSSVDLLAQLTLATQVH